MRYIARYEGRVVDTEGRASDTYVVVDTHTDIRCTPPLPYHAANDIAGLRNQGLGNVDEPGLFGAAT